MAGLGLIDKLFTSKDGKGLATQVIDGVGGIIDKYHVSPEDKMKMQEEADKMVKEHMDFVATIIAQDNANTASARDMNSKIQGDKPSWMARNVAYILDVGALVIWGSMTVYIVGRALKIIQTDEHADFNVVLGIYSGVTGVFMTVLNFHRGSSQGSADKQKTIDKLTS